MNNLPPVRAVLLLGTLGLAAVQGVFAETNTVWWAFREIQRPALPVVRGIHWPRNSLDTFILAQLEARALAPSPEAAPHVLVRRLYFDLIGLPPPPERVGHFVASPTDANYTRLVDELLASPHYGERWGRHWLDVARFGESDGFERNHPRETLWRYRDWVIEALNRDLPYDQFARLQLAGDQTDPTAAGGQRKTLAALAPVGFLVAGVHNTVVGSSDFMQKTARQDELEEMAGAVGQSFLALTVQCARCHDHKYDPISSADYYRFVSCLAGVNHGEQEFQDPAGSGKIYTVLSKPAGSTRVLARGDVRQPAEEVSPAGLKALPGLEANFELPANAQEWARRARLADWITAPGNPLFPRVMVNRLWHHHFGRGLVETPSDFGANGGRPSHPELLDWLAWEFRAAGYSLKALHRQMVLSSTYRQSSDNRPDAFALDADNQWQWRHTPRRLEAEGIRDALLAVAGQLDHSMGGPGFKDVKADYLNGTTYYTPLDAIDPQTLRRTVYRFTPRGGIGALLDTFDCPDSSGATPRRSSTTTPLQALALWNNTLVLRMSEALASRVQTEVGTDPAAQVERMHQLAYGRFPAEKEGRLCAEFVQAHGGAALARVLFNSTEFVMVK